MNKKQQFILGLKELNAEFIKYDLDFKNPAKTSRDVLHHRTVWYLNVFDVKEPQIKGIGEVAPIFGLSIEKNEAEVEKKLTEISENISNFSDYLNNDDLNQFPSIKFALETALIDLFNRASKKIFKSDFTEKANTIDINGLVWMGNKENMIAQIDQKINENYTCIKLKVGALNFNEEIEILEYIRNTFSHKITIRLDANGGFKNEEAVQKLETLSKYNIHSIEQPIKQGNWLKMKELCEKNIIPIALDEELIGIKKSQQETLLQTIKPQFIIIKPSLLGGFEASENWINLAKKQNIKYWITSALESNIGLNAIAQWTYNLNIDIPQGLGTGKLFANNIQSPLFIENGKLYFNENGFWDLTNIFKKLEMV